jgi:phage/plasmid-like protein (TIGR03299 family)
MTWEEVMQQAGLDWQVDKIQLIHPHTHEPIGAWGTFRVDQEGKYNFLGVVGNVYEIIQNKYMFDFVDALIQTEASKGAHYETAGALGNGERIWCLARINGEIDVAGLGDKHETYMLFASSHDGSLAATCKLTTVRVVCQNTLSQSINGAGASLRIKHTTEAAHRLEAAKRLLVNADLSIKTLEDKLNELAARKVSKDSLMASMKRIFGDFENATTKRIENKVNDVLHLFERNDNNAFPEIRGTAYNLFNAVTEYTDHSASVRHTGIKTGLSDMVIRSENALFGTAAALKENALDVILAETANDARHPITRTMVSMAMDKTTSLLDNVISASTPS